MNTIFNWVNNAPASSDSTRRNEVTNPATGAVIREVVLSSADDVNQAVAAAQAAFPTWRDTPPLRRARIMMKFRELLEINRDKLAALITEEHGKTFDDAQGSVTRGIEVVEFAQGIAHMLKGEIAENVGTGVDSHSLHQPLGVCAGITPFNFPAMVPLWMFPMAIACGNTFVLKPSEKVPSCSMLLAQLAKEAGLPDGVLNIVNGDKEVVDALLTHDDVKAVSFVGSTPIAKYIYQTAAEHGKRVQALGGAKNHGVVMPDCDLEFTVNALMGAAYGSAGERCMAISVAVAVGDVADVLVAKLAEKAAALKINNGMVTGTEMGPVISAAHRDKVIGYINAGQNEGATLVVDGRGVSVDGHENGFFVGGTLFDHVTPEMTIYKEEIFGPVLCVVRVATLEDAIALINRNMYANGTAVFTSNGAVARRFENAIEVGMVGVNVPIPVPISFFSFGGWRNSLFGDQHIYGPEAIRFYTRSKVITRRWPESGMAHANSFVMPTLG
ncbi:methylmalonate-semialdehyde dehydrogenase (acylating) [Formosimonas limnophila]|uniref:methylmalonate-semialdehyde dehydrogenase (CoA acylating) n=1 Tax=Formosimonas limnophila TaxID=1384487 RepID=A0A8J3CFM6_9BURK|nr:CoA-acylating methylmalonate-semialdehyde dehydrogenase [Formosimonas limnophila]GHA64629.1 methylmalonate-semialdehyde dehydrogenase (acylating) [Formosimonas limnophila]